MLTKGRFFLAVLSVVGSDGTNWTSITSTVDATTIVDGFTMGQIIDFRHCTITRDGQSEWDQIDDYVVQ